MLSQSIAQRASKEDGEVGKFWQARCLAVRLLDETAILACAAYVDLNPIRAALAETIEESDFTSVQKRCCDMRAKCSVASVQCSVDEDAGSAQVGGLLKLSRVGDTGKRSSRHLAPVELMGRSSATGPCVHKQGARCSNKGFLPMSTADYLSLLDWTARRSDHAYVGEAVGPAPESSAAISPSTIPSRSSSGNSRSLCCSLTKCCVPKFPIGVRRTALGRTSAQRCPVAV